MNKAAQGMWLLLVLGLASMATPSRGQILQGPAVRCDEPRTSVNELPGSTGAVHRITRPGSYVLTRNVFGDPGKSGIQIGSDDVTLDLNGFAVFGVAGALNGVVTDGGPRARIVVQNGTVTGWPQDGVQIRSTGSASVVRNVISSNNGLLGILVEVGGRVVDCEVLNNGFWGIRATSDNSLVRRCKVHGNLNGIDIGMDGIVERCLVTNSHGIGIRCFFSHGRVMTCSVSVCGTGILVQANGCRVDGNDLHANLGNGILVLPMIDGNVVHGNFVGGNSVRSATGVDYSIPSRNAFGPIVVVTGVGDISLVAGGNHPAANYSY